MVTYTLRAGYPSIQGATVQYDNGLMFDIEAALVSGGGTFTIDETLYPGLVASLDGHPAIRRSSTTDSVASAVPETYAPLYAYSGANPQAGDLLVRQANGTWRAQHSAEAGHVQLGYAERTVSDISITAATFDVPLVEISFTATGRPIWLECHALVQFAVGTATLGSKQQALLRIIDLDDSSIVAQGSCTGTVQTGGVVNTVMTRRRIQPAVGTNKSYKLQLQNLVLPSGASALLLGSSQPTFLSALEV